MSKELVISASPYETRVAIVEDGQLCEIYIEREKEFALVGSLYKGRVTRVLPGMQSAFVDIGLDSDAFLYVSDFLENLEDYDHVAAPPARPPVIAADTRGPRPAQPGHEVFAPSTQPVAGQAPLEDSPAGISEENTAATSSDAGHDAANADPDQAAYPAAPETPTSLSEASPPAAAHYNSAPAVSPSGPPPSPLAAPPAQPASRPYVQRPDRGSDRGRGYNDRGRSGGRNPRPGGKPGGRDRRPGRDLPSSKYASSSTSSRPFESRPRESQPYEPPPADYVPVILPGESLAKYKDRIPGAAAPATPAAVPDTSSQNTESRIPSADSAQIPAAAGLPQSLYAPASRPADANRDPRTETAAGLTSDSAAYQPAENAAQHSAATQESDGQAELAAHDESRDDTPNDTNLSDDEVTALAEQLAEAKHEEAQAGAEDRIDAEEAAAEPFVGAAELEDLQDALHADEVLEADETADEMHEEALAAESSAEQSTDQSEDSGAESVAGNGETEGGEASAENAGEQSGSEPQSSLNAPPDAQPDAQSGAPAMNARISEQPRARFQRPMRRGGRPQRGGRPSGRPPDRRPHQHPSHPQHRRPQLISEMLKAGQEIIVQIAKEPLGKKGARITSHVALPGRFLVYMPTVDHIGVSRRIGSAEDRSRLRRVVTEAKGTFPGGFIVRTAAGGATDDEIRADVEFLGHTWDTIRGNSEQRHAPSLLHRDLNLVERILRDYLSDDYVAIWIDNEEEYAKVTDFVNRFQPRMTGRVKLYTKEAPIFEEFGIQQDLDKALRPKVWLKSGGYIVINHTEALVAIDVNTGKYVGRGSTRLEDTIVKTNVEAVKEIVRQIRLRDLGGIIVIDFIDMEERRNRDKVLSALEEALNQDRAPSKALSFNEFGLVCITRKRTKQALERVLCQPCPYCTGSGMVKSIPTICFEIQAEARKMSPDLNAASITLRVNPEIAKTLKTRESSLIEELEQKTRKSVIIQSDPTLHWEQYDIY